MALQIGVSDLEGGGSSSSFKSANWFQIKANEANAYRVLPPIFSNAATGRWSQFAATHSVWVSTANGKRRPFHFHCIQEKDKSGNITVECPFCTMAVENKQRYETLKAKMPNPTAEDKKKLQEYLQTQVWSFQANKKVYLNVISLDGSAGVLTIPYKCLISLKAKLLDIRAQWGQDPTGNPGMFLNFKKIQQYKGDRDTTYSVEQYMEHAVDANGQPIARPKSHMLDDQATTNIEKNCKDLSELFKTISSEQIHQILASYSDVTALTQLLESIFSEPEAVASTKMIEDAQTGAQYAVKTELANNTINTQSNLPQAPTPVAAPVAAPVAGIELQVEAPVAAPATQAPVVGSSVEAMNDDEFAAQFFGE